MTTPLFRLRRAEVQRLLSEEMTKLVFDWRAGNFRIDDTSWDGLARKLIERLDPQHKAPELLRLAAEAELSFLMASQDPELQGRIFRNSRH